MKILDDMISTSSDILFKGKYISIESPVNFPYEATVCGDCAAVIPFRISDKKILIRREVLPAYYIKSVNPYWYTIVTGGIEPNEKFYDAMKRELREETGVVLIKEDTVELEFIGPIFKCLANRIFLFSVELTEDNHTNVEITTDGTKYEKMAENIWMSIDEIDMTNSDFLLYSAIQILKNKGKL